MGARYARRSTLFDESMKSNFSRLHVQACYCTLCKQRFRNWRRECRMAKRKLKSGVWSKEEVKQLKQMFRSTSTKKVAEKLGRAERSVEAKASKLGLKKTKKYLKSIGRSK